MTAKHGVDGVCYEKKVIPVRKRCMALACGSDRVQVSSPADPSMDDAASDRPRKDTGIIRRIILPVLP